MKVQNKSFKMYNSKNENFETINGKNLKTTSNLRTKSVFQIFLFYRYDRYDHIIIYPIFLSLGQNTNSFGVT